MKAISYYYINESIYHSIVILYSCRNKNFLQRTIALGFLRLNKIMYNLTLRLTSYKLISCLTFVGTGRGKEVR